MFAVHQIRETTKEVMGILARFHSETEAREYAANYNRFSQDYTWNAIRADVQPETEIINFPRLNCYNGK